MDYNLLTQTLFEQHPDPIVLVDKHGVCRQVNAAFAKYSNLAVDQVAGKPLAAVLQQEQLRNVWHQVAQRNTLELTLYQTLGLGTSSVKVRFLPVHLAGELTAFYVLFSDINEQNRLLINYQSAIRMLELFESNSSDAIVLLDREGTVQYVSASYSMIFGRAGSEILHQNALGFIHPEDQGFLMERLAESFSGEIYWPPLEFRYLHGDGHWIDTEVRATAVVHEQRIEEIMLLARDVSLRKQQEAKIHRMAYHDSLTDLPNRHYLSEHLASLLERRQQQSLICLMFIDLDRFKQVNDCHGHSLGDLLLQQVAARLTQQLDRRAFLARMGGDEFVVLTHHLSTTEGCLNLAEEIVRLMDLPYTVQQLSVQITTSVGISVSPLHGQTTEELIRTADIALYWAKNHGKNRYAMYSC